MSRAQWGHGYWQGVKDAEFRKKRARMDDEAAFMVCNMCIMNANKDYNRSLFPVKEFISFCRFAGLNKEYAKSVYDYIMANEPYGCYISGDVDWDWEYDYFCLPCGEKEFWIQERKYWIDKQKEETK